MRIKGDREVLSYEPGHVLQPDITILVSSLGRDFFFPFHSHSCLGHCAGVPSLSFLYSIFNSYHLFIFLSLACMGLRLVVLGSQAPLPADHRALVS